MYILLHVRQSIVCDQSVNNMNTHSESINIQFLGPEVTAGSSDSRIGTTLCSRPNIASNFNVSNIPVNPNSPQQMSFAQFYDCFYFLLLVKITIIIIIIIIIEIFLKFKQTFLR